MARHTLRHPETENATESRVVLNQLQGVVRRVVGTADGVDEGVVQLDQACRHGNTPFK